jgi:hypothetical protein
MPSGVNIARSRPAEKDGPSPRTTSTRTVPGSALTVRLSQAQVSGFWTLRLAGRLRVKVAT